MSQRYPGGLLSRSAPVVVGPTDGEGGSAPGVWTLEQAGGYIKQGLWPRPIVPRALYSFGNNSDGGLGLSDVVTRSSPTQVGALTNWSKIAGCKYNSTVAIKSDGTMWSWGSNFYGQLGQNNGSVYRSSPVQVGALTTWMNVTCGYANTIAVKTDGTLWSWGRNNYGQLGQNDRVNRSSPVQIGSGTTWLNISCINYSALATKSDGTLWAWGYNGVGTVGDNTVVNRSSPVQLGALTTWSKVAAGGQHSMATKTDGTLWVWGNNNAGQLGQNSIINRSSPIQVGSLSTWLTPSAGIYFSLATKTNSTLELWGQGGYGQLGQNSGVSFSSPVQVGGSTTWSSATAGHYQTLAVKTDGSLWTWGQNTYGQLGQNISTNVSSPTQVGALATWSSSASSFRFSFALNAPSLEASNLWVSGYNLNGQLGQGNVTYKSSPVQVSSRTKWSVAEGGTQFVAAIRTDGTLWSWGANSNGKLGLNDINISRSIATQVGNLTNWSKVACGAQSVTSIKTDGTLWSWGQNIYGQVGDNTVISRSSPVQIGALTTWSLTSGGNYHSLAVKTDGTLWAWGLNNEGQLGLNIAYSSYKSSPTQVGALTTWASVSGGSSNSAAVKTDGTLWTWGRASNGCLGQNNTVNRSSPVQVGADTNWSSIANGLEFSMFAVKNDGTLWAWGANGAGQLGLNNTVSRSSPVQVGALTTWSKVATISGQSGAMAIKTDGTLWTWGSNSYGSLGVNNTNGYSSPVQVGSLTSWSNVFKNASSMLLATTT